jgi:hypothetical protein
MERKPACQHTEPNNPQTGVSENELSEKIDPQTHGF